MKNQKKKSKKMTMDELASLMKQGFDSVEKKLETNQEKMATMVLNALQNTQDLIIGEMNKNFSEVDNRFNTIEKDVKEVKGKLNGFIEEYKEEKLPMRVEYIENVLNISKK